MGFYDYSRFQGGFSWLQVGFMVFQGSRLVFLVPECFFVGFQGSRLICHGSRSGFGGFRLVFMVLGQFLWF